MVVCKVWMGRVRRGDGGQKGGSGSGDFHRGHADISHGPDKGNEKEGWW